MTLAGGKAAPGAPGARRITPGLRLGVVFLLVGYMLSQFFRAVLPVMTPTLGPDIGASAQDLARASGFWFVGFACAQLPIGWSLDRFGPRWTACLPLALCGGGGALLFAMAQAPGALVVAEVLIGIGCAPVLVAAYFIYAREFSPAVFGTLAGLSVAVGSLGNIAGTLPMAGLVGWLGWRGAMLAMAVVTVATGLAIARWTPNPAPLPEGGGGASFLSVLRQRSVWLIALMMVAGYAPAGNIRGLWVGPHLAEVYGLDATRIGQITLMMGLAMVAGNLAYGPVDRLIGSRKWGVFTGNLLLILPLLALARWPEAGIWPTAAMFAGLGFVGASYPAVMAHGRGFFPPHLVGRGVSFLTCIAIGGTGVLQVVSGHVHAAWAGQGVAASYSAVYLFFAGVVAVGLTLYFFSKDRVD